MKLALVGEAYGTEEATYGKPFIGAAGQELNRMLSDAGLNREQCMVTNVFNFQPQRNDISTLCAPRTSVNNFRSWPSLVKGAYLKDEYAGEIVRLHTELTNARPNLVVALGNTASWALLKQTSIGKIRGAIASSTLVNGLKVLPTYHPAAILRQYELRHVAVLDLQKAKVECEFPEIRIPVRTIYMEPTIEDLFEWLKTLEAHRGPIAFDIETASEQITCIGFSPDYRSAYVVPFVDLRKQGNYWPTLEHELIAWNFVKRVLALPNPKIAQNGLYDIQYLWRVYGIPVTNFSEDTMILHHSLHPESDKGLGFLGSVYTNSPAWKDMRGRGEKTIKRED